MKEFVRIPQEHSRTQENRTLKDSNMLQYNGSYKISIAFQGGEIYCKFIFWTKFYLI